MVKRRTTQKARAKGAATVVTIRVGLRPDQEARVLATAPIQRMAEEWTYLLRSRTRWADDINLRVRIRQRALEDLRRLVARPEFFRALATAAHVEVELHDWDVKDAAAAPLHEAAAELPWEYLISAATRELGRHDSLLVTRLFRNTRKDAVIPEPPNKVLFVESAPGRLEDIFSFSQEEVRIAAAVAGRLLRSRHKARTQDSGPIVQLSETETLSAVRRRVRSDRWDVIHLSGIDTHQAGWMVDGFYDDLEEKRAGWRKVVGPRETGERIADGMILRERNEPELPVRYDELADALIDSRRTPWLVTLNLYYSGARTAREMVRRGALCAIGFLDEIDDDLAERFFQALYWSWCHPETLPEASDVSEPVDALAIDTVFRNAWRRMTAGSHERDVRLHGTAVVIWLGISYFERWKVAVPERLRQPVTDDETSRQRLDRMRIDEILQVQFEVPPEVNYSLLHNERSLLDRLTLTKLVPEPLEDIQVQLELNLGSQNYPFRCTHLVLDEPQRELGPDVCIPLTATLPRSLRERVVSTVYLKVTCRGRTALETTRRVTLIPVDQWLDDTDNNPWLPSFVLPRDPAVLKIISAARRHLIGIQDNPAAGFDGYQSVDEDAENPTEGVDAQVRAIWTALVNEFRLQYINPPPAYSLQSQRLRTPSDILASNSGTCIDLALLLASCLEYVEVYPVVILLTGHAFVGYWRSEEAYDAFVEVLHVPAEVPPAGSDQARLSGHRLVDPYGWRLNRLHYDEIMDYVTSGDLVLLEATYLTGAYSFAEAVKEGRANMRSKREFDSLLDIQLARAASPPVTPLPIIFE